MCCPDVVMDTAGIVFRRKIPPGGIHYADIHPAASASGGAEISTFSPRPCRPDVESFSHSDVADAAAALLGEAPD